MEAEKPLHLFKERRQEDRSRWWCGRWRERGGVRRDKVADGVGSAGAEAYDAFHTSSIKASQHHYGGGAPSLHGVVNGFCDLAYFLVTCPLSPSGSNLVNPSTSQWTEP